MTMAIDMLDDMAMVICLHLDFGYIDVLDRFLIIIGFFIILSICSLNIVPGYDIL